MAFDSATLPIDHSNGFSMDPVEARALGEILSESYQAADPFPHIVIDDFLPAALIQDVLRNFPAEKLESDVNFNIGYGGLHKRQIMPEDCNSFNLSLFHFFNSRPVLQFLEGLTGIDALLPDPYFDGGGFHETTRGGKLGIHADFRINERLHLQRRVNLLIYLNPVWQDEWFGQLELWDRGMKECKARVSPILNRCVIFSTESDTWHGHPDALNSPEGVARRSIALYYYTASKEIYKEVPSMSTLYKARPTDSKETKVEALLFQSDQYFKQWAPPIFVRNYYRVWNKLKRTISRSRAE